MSSAVDLLSKATVQIFDKLLKRYRIRHGTPKLIICHSVSYDVDDMPQQSIMIVGAGVAGLQAARALLRRGFDVLVIEQNTDLGGVWTKNYSGFGLQGKPTSFLSYRAWDDWHFT
eukprot:jgi/Chrzof1/3655/Cz13g03280.t1